MLAAWLFVHRVGVRHPLDTVTSRRGDRRALWDDVDGRLIRAAVLHVVKTRC